MTFEALTPAKADPILGLTAAFKEDQNPMKVNLGVGIYVDETGTTPILESVKAAEEAILQGETTKSYLPIEGDPTYAQIVQSLMFGADHPIITEERVQTAHTPGGTGALRLGAEFLKLINMQTVWISDPTWANHKGIFSDAGYTIKEYPYYNAETRNIDFDAMCETLRAVPAGDIVLLHVCCHNPTGADLTPDQWQVIAGISVEAGWMPFFDFAYQGFGTGIAEDRAGLELFSDTGNDFLVASSFSKNFGLYRERVGALTLVASTKMAATAAMSNLRITIRRLYSNPPAHGAAIVTHILSSSSLRKFWVQEVALMRDRMNEARTGFSEAMKARNVNMDFSHLATQRGMFSLSGLSKEQVLYLREKKSIYIIDSGRINVAGITPDNIDYVCDSIAEAITSAPQ